MVACVAVPWGEMACVAVTPSREVAYGEVTWRGAELCGSVSWLEVVRRGMKPSLEVACRELPCCGVKPSAGLTGM